MSTQREREVRYDRVRRQLLQNLEAKLDSGVVTLEDLKAFLICPESVHTALSETELARRLGEQERSLQVQSEVSGLLYAFTGLEDDLLRVMKLLHRLDESTRQRVLSILVYAHLRNNKEVEAREAIDLISPCVSAVGARIRLYETTQDAAVLLQARRMARTLVEGQRPAALHLLSTKLGYDEDYRRLMDCEQQYIGYKVKAAVARGDLALARKLLEHVSDEQGAELHLMLAEKTRADADVAKAVMWFPRLPENGGFLWRAVQILGECDRGNIVRDWAATQPATIQLLAAASLLLTRTGNMIDQRVATAMAAESTMRHNQANLARTFYAFHLAREGDITGAKAQLVRVSAQIHRTKGLLAVTLIRRGADPLPFMLERF